MLLSNLFEEGNHRQLLEKGQKILVAFSGGPDSVALLSILEALKEEMSLTLGACHLNHGLRESAKKEEAFCHGFCVERNIPFYIKRVDVAAMAKDEGLSIEAAGRLARYDFFEEILTKERYDLCVTAHHADDQVETVLLNLFRGTGLKGLTGMDPQRGRYVKPLLLMTKKEILAYVEKQGLPYVMDESNEENDFQRNRVRNELLPYLATHFNKDISSSILRMSDLLREDLTYIEDQVEGVKAQYLVKEGLRVRVLKEAAKLPKALKMRLLLAAIFMVKGDVKDIEEVHLHLLQELFHLETGKVLDIKAGIQGRNDYGDLIMEQKNQSTERKNNMLHEELTIPGTYEVSGHRITLRYISKEEMKKEKALRFFNGDLFQGPMILRHREEGDRMRPFGMKGYRKLKNILIDRKISREDREDLLVFQYEKDVIYIGGMMISEDYKVKESTEKVLEIGLYKEEK